ncbi:MAG: pentapeptide repeat-containing protein [candidate division Zixibacteria bacterium]|nr:pentapeptide repeat-containing protein [candidate division Zixibacteria bacterium]
MHDGKPCGRDLHDEEYCIFHSKKDDKDVTLFQRGLNEILSVVSVKAHDLTRFIFPEGVVFPKKFSKPVAFKKAIFRGEAHFNNSLFEKEADFVGTIFKDRANFWGVAFTDGADFYRALFEGDAYLGGAAFTGKANFRETVFKGEANFRDAFFRGETHFGGAAFKGELYFWNARFKGEAGFRGAVFKGGTYFLYAAFKGEADFRDAAFKDKAYFTDATFEDTLLINAEIHDKKGFHQEIDFRSVKFSKPEKVIFQKVDLSKFRFLETDLRGVHFTDVDWNKEKGKGRNMVFDEVFHDPRTKKPDYTLIAQLYRRLRANYEENLRYSEAGDFYIGEMEMTRKAQTSIFKKLPLLFYKTLSNYGESYYRPLGWIAAILLVFPLLFMFAGIQPVNLDRGNPTGDVVNYRLDFSIIESFAPTWEKLNDYYTCFLYTMSVFSFIRDKKYTTIDNWGHTLFVVESILSPVTLAFFLLALRRRFKR